MSSKLDVALAKEYQRLFKVAKKILPNMDSMSMSIATGRGGSRYLHIWVGSEIVEAMYYSDLTTNQLITKMKQELGKKYDFDVDIPF